MLKTRFNAFMKLNAEWDGLESGYPVNPVIKTQRKKLSQREHNNTDLTHQNSNQLVN